MTATFSGDMNRDAAAPSSDARWQLLQRVLTSPVFNKAPRMCALLSFLMNRKLSGMEASITEYVIGIEVFGRDANDYCTAIDPVVRVQMGRLRDRLAQYYAGDAAPHLQIVFPAGSYVPELIEREATPQTPNLTMKMGSVRLLTSGPEATQFALGLEEELSLQIFRRYPGAPGGSAALRLEVGLRIEQAHARASIKLIDAGSEHPAWLHQCDVHGALGMDLQETLAKEICNDLQRFIVSAPIDPNPCQRDLSPFAPLLAYVGRRMLPS